MTWPHPPRNDSLSSLLSYRWPNSGVLARIRCRRGAFVKYDANVIVEDEELSKIQEGEVSNDSEPGGARRVSESNVGGSSEPIRFGRPPSDRLQR